MQKSDPRLAKTKAKVPVKMPAESLVKKLEENQVITKFLNCFMEIQYSQTPI